MDSSISVISDVHIKKCQDKAYALLMSFFNHPMVKSSGAIYLLGDIFDFMVGRQKEYLELYKNYFHLLGELLNDGKEIHYFQGNHDVHVELNYRDYFRYHHITDHRFIYHDRPLVKRIWGKTFFFAHGDEIEIGNIGYKIYKAILSTPVTKLLAENILSYNLLHYLGESASEASRKRNKRYDPNLVRQSFRMAATKLATKGYDYIICGHSHIKDDYVYHGDRQCHFTYLNNGHALDSNTFIYLDKGQYSFIDL